MLESKCMSKKTIWIEWFSFSVSVHISFFCVCVCKIAFNFYFPFHARTHMRTHARTLISMICEISKLFCLLKLNTFYHGMEAMANRRDSHCQQHSYRLFEVLFARKQMVYPASYLFISVKKTQQR